MTEIQKNDIDVFIVIDDDTCPLCLDPINNKQKLNCNHNFCSFCINNWHETRRGCPLCDDSLNKEQVAYKEAEKLSIDDIILSDILTYPTNNLSYSPTIVYAVPSMASMMYGMGTLRYSN